MDEAIIMLSSNMDFINSLVQSSFFEEQENMKIDQIQFINLIESNTFWMKQIGNYEHNIQKILDKLAS